MGRRADDSLYLSLSRGMCRECREIVEARYVSEGGGVWLERHCPEHGVGKALVAESLAWYLDALKSPAADRPPESTVPRTGGCPTSCGPCEFHAQRVNLPVISITNACDLRCPLCFTWNREDRPWHMEPAEFAETIDFVVRSAGAVDLVNVTGGEPTMHPRLLELLPHARRPEIGRITVNTNGLRLSRDPDLAAGLAELGVYVILSLDTLDAERSIRLHGRDVAAEKRRALEVLEAHGIPTTILMVLVGGENEDELETVLDLALSKAFVRSLTIQTMTYTGQGGGSFLPRRHLPVDAVERMIEEATGGRIRQSDFQPLPTAHPLCYGVTYLLADGEGGAEPFSGLLDREVIARSLSDGYLMHPTPELRESLLAAIDRLWSEGDRPDALRALKRMLAELYPTGESLTTAERQARAEAMVKTIYVHAHMDEDTWESGRAMRCPDQVPVDGERLISACNYNLFRRPADARFSEDA